MSSARRGYGSPGAGSPPCSRCCDIPPAYVVATGSAQQQTATQHTATNEEVTNGERQRPMTDAGERSTRYDLPPLHAVVSYARSLRTVVVIPIQGEARELPDCVIRLSDTSTAQEVFRPLVS